MQRTSGFDDFVSLKGKKDERKNATFKSQAGCFTWKSLQIGAPELKLHFDEIHLKK